MSAYPDVWQYEGTWYAKGHHDRSTFDELVRDVMRKEGDLDEGEAMPLVWERFRHQTYRCVPIPHHNDDTIAFQMYPAEPGSRGAFAVTEGW